MLKNLHLNKQSQLILGLFMGIIFGFLLQKGGAGKYDIILGQLLLKDFTVLKLMLSAVVVGMIGIYILKGLKLAQLHPKPGSVGMNVIGGLIFGVGFAVLGYCPGTISAAIGQGNLDALFGGLIGILVGSAIFAHLYPSLQGILKKGWFGDITLPQYFKVNHWVVILPLCIVIILFFYWIESMGL
jgi:hypothetical protein